MTRYQLQETSMSDAPDVDDRVDYEDGSSSEMEEEEHVEEYEEEEDDDDNQDVDREEGQEELAEDEDNNIDIDIETAEDEEKSPSPIDEEREEYSRLLSLPPHGSEVFIGGLPRDVGEEDLRDLCEPIGDIFEVGTSIIFCALFSMNLSVSTADF